MSVQQKMILCLLFVFLAYRGIKISLRAPDLFGTLLGSGITFMIVIQAAINMGVVIGLLPTKGLTLPFISSGGSSIVITMMSVGILLNIASQSSLQGKGIKK